jgi:uncharacterized protein YcfJ
MSRRALLPILGIMLLAHIPSTARSQQLVAGDAIRVRLTPDTLKRPSFRDHRWSGLALGAVAGGAGGALVALAYSEPLENLSFGCSILSSVCPDEIVDPRVPVNSQAQETVTGAVVGALIGGAAGYFIGRHLGHWETVELDRAMIGDGNVALSFSIRR